MSRVAVVMPEGASLSDAINQAFPVIDQIDSSVYDHRQDQSK
jgi:hypothetical protein